MQKLKLLTPLLILWMAFPLVAENVSQPEPMQNQDDTESVDPAPQAPPEGQWPEGVLKLDTTQFFSSVAFVADKSRRTLTIWRQQGQDLKFISAHPMDKGRSDGDKFVLGDLKTPEGIYFFQKKYEGPNLNFDEYGKRAFTMNYPNFFDMLEGKTGSGIWLHAIPETKNLYRGSRGCLVVRNDVIESVSDFIDLKNTPIIVQERVNYVDPNKIKSRRSNLENWLQEWKNGWESKDISTYIGFYGDRFKSKGLNKAQWKTYKSGLNEKYDFIQVKIDRPIVLNHQNEYVVKFIQKYQSDKLSDYGIKSLFIEKSEQGFQIIGEDWAPAKNDEIAKAQNKASQAF